jgi:ABC-type antimicrobial peptide transport system permease subunit
LRDHWVEIVGVVGSKRHRDLSQEPLLELFVPRRQQTGGRAMWMVVRTTDPPSVMLGTLRRILREMDPAIAFANPSVLRDRVALSISPQRFRSMMVGALACVAVILSVIGIWSLTSFSVSRQKRDIGVRIALGMEPGRARSGILARAVGVASAGVGIGVLLTVLAVRAIDTQVFGVPRVDPVIVAGVALFLLAITVAASATPAWRASSIDPQEAMRSP